MSTRYPTPWDCRVSLAPARTLDPEVARKRYLKKVVPGHRILESFLEGFSNILSPLAIKTTSQFGEEAQEQARKSFTNLALIQVGVILLYYIYGHRKQRTPFSHVKRRNVTSLPAACLDERPTHLTMLLVPVPAIGSWISTTIIN